MKRSKLLLLSNIFSTLYGLYLLIKFGGAIIEAGGVEFIDALATYFELAFDIIGMNSPAVTFLYVLLVLICIHIIGFVLGALLGWIAYIGKKSGIAKCSAVFYLIGTICFPIYLFFGLPITIVGFLAAGKQKEINIIT